MNIDGTNTLACLKAINDIRGDVRIYPLPHMPVIKDLVPDLTHVYAQYRSIQPWLQDRERAATRPRAAAIDRGARQARRAVGMHPVLLLHDPCPSYWWNGERYLGPAVLLQAYRWLADSRDEETGERLDQLEDPFRLYRCHTIMNCTRTCPKNLNPAKAIAEIKKMLVLRR